uniref:Uncharacterized protein n=1 Tax=Anguilla anguilla TaxID=7936 RepID=A0A0E9RG04_ANGAN
MNHFFLLSIFLLILNVKNEDKRIRFLLDSNTKK